VQGGIDLSELAMDIFFFFRSLIKQDAQLKTVPSAARPSNVFGSPGSFPAVPKLD
jgi:hypothetical protein